MQQGQSGMLATGTVAAVNAETARIPLPEARLPAVALELAQLAQAAEAVRARLNFDAEPAAFAAMLDRLAP